MKQIIYQVDAFTNNIFFGNPAAICPLENWLKEDTMQNIAAENNLSETAFFVKNGTSYDIRWFTPTTEIDLCGHATLASAHIILNYLEPNATKVNFNYKLGKLEVVKKGELLEMDFPANVPSPIPERNGLVDALGIKPLECLENNFCLVVLNNEEEVKNLKPDFSLLKSVHPHGVIVTAPGNDVDFVSRVFVPAMGINEDPVTGSAHTELIPFWSKKLNKTNLSARQISLRGGDLQCEYKGDRVKMAGKAALYLKGEIYF